MSSVWTRRRGSRPEVVLGWLGAALLVVLVYAVVVRGGGVLIGRTDSPHLGLSVLATAIVAIVIEPVRAWVEQRSSRWLRRGRPAPYAVLSEFSHQLTGAGDEAQITARIAQVLAEGVSASWAQVWLVVNDRLTLMATYPPQDDPLLVPPSLAGDETADGLRSVVVGHGGGRLGVLRVRERPDEPLSGVEQRLFAGLAAQAGLALHNAKLRAELSQRRRDLEVKAVDLRRSRDELVFAEDKERRRLERDIHDGAQQQLVALGINLRLAQTLAGRDPQQAADLLMGQADAAVDAIETLSALSRGVHPRVLEEQGLAEALADAAARTPVPTRVEVSAPGRYATDIEAALYFCCLEALQNAVKHAGASGIEVRLDPVGSHHLRLEVVDDGRGLRPDALTRPGRGIGVTSMRERIESLRGSFRVESDPGRGTSVVAVVPATPFEGGAR